MFSNLYNRSQLQKKTYALFGYRAKHKYVQFQIKDEKDSDINSERGMFDRGCAFPFIAWTKHSVKHFHSLRLSTQHVLIIQTYKTAIYNQTPKSQYAAVYKHIHRQNIWILLLRQDMYLKYTFDASKNKLFQVRQSVAPIVHSTMKIIQMPSFITYTTQLPFQSYPFSVYR